MPLTQTENSSFVQEMKMVALKLHSKELSKDGERDPVEPDDFALTKWQPTAHGYLRFLVDSLLVNQTLEMLLNKASFPFYAEFRNTGLERSENLTRDLEWFKDQGHVIPEPSSLGYAYATYVEQVAENDPVAFVYHFYSIHFGHTTGGRMVGRMVSGKILDNKVLEFYKWDATLSVLQDNVREKIDKITDSWSREEKKHCLEEGPKAFNFARSMFRLILT